MKRENFITIIEGIKEQNEFDHKATKALDIIFEDVIGGFYKNHFIINAINKMLKNEFNDIGDWIGYFIYELDYGEKWTKTTASRKDGSMIDISTINKLYDFLMEKK